MDRVRVFPLTTFPNTARASQISPSTSDLPALPVEQIHRQFDGGTLSRGKSYFKQNKVVRLTADVTPREGILYLSLDGKVRGRSRYVYEQDIEIRYGHHEDDDGVKIDGYCSCPVGFNCKHVAALCLHYQATLGKDGTKPGAKKPKDGFGFDPAVRAWINRLISANGPSQLDPQTERLLYLVQPHDALKGAFPYADDNRNPKLQIFVSRPRKNGQGMVRGRSVTPDRVIESDYASRVHGYSLLSDCHIDPLDPDIARLLQADFQAYSQIASLAGRTGAIALGMLIDSGRCYPHSFKGAPLRRGEPRPLELQWQSTKKREILHHQLQGGGELLDLEPPWYIDWEQGLAGPVETGNIQAPLLRELLHSPAIPEDQAMAVSQVLVGHFNQSSLPAPREVPLRENQGQCPMPHVQLVRLQTPSAPQHALLLNFLYGDDPVPARPSHPVFTFNTGKELLRVTRDLDAEAGVAQRLLALGFETASPVDKAAGPSQWMSPESKIGESAARWARFLEQDIKALRREGWQIEIDDSFQLSFVDGDWSAEINEQAGNDWFNLRFDLELDGQRLPLAPLLAPLVGLDPNVLSDPLVLPLEENRYVRLPVKRLRPFLSTLNELLDRAPSDADGNLSLSRWDAASIGDLGAQGIALRGGETLQAMAERLRDFQGIQPVEPPEGFEAELRPYQQKGLDWLQFLRAYDLNGILADDMGLGKTIQTLAHLLHEKRTGRLDRPALVVAPTSLMGNWRREAERFAPDLRVDVLHGPQRHERFAHIGEHDLLLTTYPLLPRDIDQLTEQSYHYLVLDEAQAIKNPKTKLAACVRSLDTRHRLCLTGTPLENHLGELWALFDFLMPGFLGDSPRFTRAYRTPIEKHRNGERAAGLARRVQPFMLRRTKDAVAGELPDKTEMVIRVPFERAQAELYENIRVTMDKKVRDAIASQGMARSHITILDALLKLRQVCCDPRLLKLKRDYAIDASAKLNALTAMLEEQLDEGRRILLFSQFTSMLGLIETELKSRRIDYSKLTGQTRKREQAIDRFRSGEAKLFLISLKAGGVGLNLTEADTVILYDPWWNPAVEAQAIDRAHRIGQRKPVFVYRLVAEHSLEEKMLAMQARKQALAEGVYRDDAQADTPLLDTDTLASLFAPLPT